MCIDELKKSIIELYQIVKIRKESEAKIIDKEFLEKEKISLNSISPMVLIDYIKSHLNLIIDNKVKEKMEKLKREPIEYISYYGTDIPVNDYEKLLRRYEGDIRNYIQMVNILKIHIDELNQKQELLQNQIEQFQKESFNFIPTNKSLEYKKKIMELTTLIKSYEKYNLKIPLLEKKIKIQKIELDKLDSYYKKQIKSFTKKLEDYEKGIYLNKNNSMIKKIKVIKSLYNNYSNKKKIKNRLNSISSHKENKTLSSYRYPEANTEIDKKFKKIKKYSSIKTIFLFSKNNNEVKKKLDEKIEKIVNGKNNISVNSYRNINININHRSLNKSFQNNNSNKKNISSPKNDKKEIHNYYDSIETDTAYDNKIQKTINISGTTISNFYKKSYIKSNSIKRALYTNKIREKEKEKDKDKDKDQNSSKQKYKSRSNSKKEMKKLRSNKSFKIPKNNRDQLKTYKYISIKKKDNLKYNRYNSLKQLINEKTINNRNSNKENEHFNKTFSKISNLEEINSNSRSNNNKNKKLGKVDKLVILKHIRSSIINGRTPIPIKKSKSKHNQLLNKI